MSCNLSLYCIDLDDSDAFIITWVGWEIFLNVSSFVSFVSVIKDLVKDNQENDSLHLLINELWEK